MTTRKLTVGSGRCDGLEGENGGEGGRRIKRGARLARYGGLSIKGPGDVCAVRTELLLLLLLLLV